MVSPSIFRIDPLAASHERAGFRCGNEALDRYLSQQARQDAKRRVAAPFVLTEPPSPRVLGFYTLSASVVQSDELPAALASTLPRYPQLPVTLLGRLAVDQASKGSGIGQLLLIDALRRSLDASVGIGSMAVLVAAKDEAAAAFYRHFDFMPLQQPHPGQSQRLFLPMKTVAALFAKS